MAALHINSKKLYYNILLISTSVSLNTNTLYYPTSIRGHVANVFVFAKTRNFFYQLVLLTMANLARASESRVH